MTLVVNLVRTVSSAKFICGCCRNPWCDSHVTRTPKCNESAKIRSFIINFGLTILIDSVLSLCRLRIMTQLRSGAVDKMADIFTQRIWQPYLCQPNELTWEKKKTGGNKRGAKQKSRGGHGPPRPPLRIVIDHDKVSIYCVPTDHSVKAKSQICLYASWEHLILKMQHSTTKQSKQKISPNLDDH